MEQITIPRLRKALAPLFETYGLTPDKTKFVRRDPNRSCVLGIRRSVQIDDDFTVDIDFTIRFAAKEYEIIFFQRPPVEVGPTQLNFDQAIERLREVLETQIGPFVDEILTEDDLLHLEKKNKYDCYRRSL